MELKSIALYSSRCFHRQRGKGWAEVDTSRWCTAPGSGSAPSSSGSAAPWTSLGESQELARTRPRAQAGDGQQSSRPEGSLLRTAQKDPWETSSQRHPIPSSPWLLAPASIDMLHLESQHPSYKTPETLTLLPSQELRALGSSLASTTEPSVALGSSCCLP